MKDKALATISNAMDDEIATYTAGKIEEIAATLDELREDFFEVQELIQYMGGWEGFKATYQEEYEVDFDEDIADWMDEIERVLR